MRLRAALLFLATVAFVESSAQQQYYDALAGEGNGFRFWNGNDNYKIHMGSASEYFYGPVTDYSIKSNMYNISGRGWTWGSSGVTPVAALNTSGEMQVAGTFMAMGRYMGLGTATPSNMDGWDRVLDVRGGPHSKIIASSDNASNIVGLYSHNSWDGAYAGGLVGTETNHSLFLMTNKTIKAVIGNDGKVGIGTMSPQINFEVVGSGQIIRNAGASSYTTLRLYNNTNNMMRSLEIDYSGSSYSGPLVTGGPAGESGSITTVGGYPLTLGTANTMRMTIREDGNVGIGTATPTAGRLQVTQSIDDSDHGIAIQNSTGVRIMRMWADPNNSYMYSGVTGQANLILNNTGNVGIGTTTPDAKLSVKGQVHAQEVKVDLNGAVAPDYVFDKEYKLPSLEEVKSYIVKNNHLPEVPSAKEMEENGMNLGEMNLILLKKVEELTLYVIELKRENQVTRTEFSNKLDSLSRVRANRN